MSIDETDIAQRLQHLSQQRSSSRYVRQKSALESEFAHFLASLTSAKSLASALPEDVIAFLVWKDRAGKTKVHIFSCPALSRPDLSCACPKRLAFGTVDSMIGKLRAILADNGRGSAWHPLLGVGNPAACWSVKTYLANVREEQLRARVTPQQADPILVGDLAFISTHIEHMLLHKANSAIPIFVHARDQALFKTLFFAGDRGADVLLTKVSDILRLPDNSRFLFNHIWTKTSYNNSSVCESSNRMVVGVGKARAIPPHLTTIS